MGQIELQRQQEQARSTVGVCVEKQLHAVMQSHIMEHAARNPAQGKVSEKTGDPIHRDQTSAAAPSNLPPQATQNFRAPCRNRHVLGTGIQEGTMDHRTPRASPLQSDQSTQETTE